MNQLTPTIILSVIAGYFIILMAVSYFTSKSADNNTFFVAGRKSPWILVAIGMIGASLSGVTFISIPGAIGGMDKNMEFSYMQMVLGYLVGYAVIALILMPIYYKQNLISIYGYLEKRFGFYSYKTGAAYFLLSRIIGASFRLYLVAIVIDQFVLGPLGVPFWLTVFMSIVLIWIYTFRGGIRTIVWTDTLQTVCMLTAVVLTVYFIMNGLERPVTEVGALISENGLDQMFFFENSWNDPNNFFKQFISGAFIAVVMTGLDQDMMQKNLTCRNLGAAQKNIFTFSVILVFANILFIALGALLYIYAQTKGIAIPEKTDLLFPELAINHLPMTVGIVFIIGLIAAAYSSADSALTSLTTSFCIDFLNFEKDDSKTEKEKKRTRIAVHIGFSIILFLVIIVFNALNNDAVINKLFEFAGYTYGPLLGLFAFGILTNFKIRDPWVILICILAPIISYIINMNSEAWLGGFTFGFLIIVLNGFLTFLGLLAISKFNAHE